MGDNTHTELPWSISEPFEKDQIVNIWSDGDEARTPCVVTTCEMKDAELIVKAVNNHDLLVEALKRAKSFLERTNCGGYTKGHKGDIYIDEGSTYDAIEKAFFNLEALSKAGE